MSDLKKNRLPETLAELPPASDDTALQAFTRDGSETLTFNELRDRAGRLALGLRRQEDADKPVALFSPASAPAITAVFGILRSGRVCVPLDSQMPDKDLVSVLENCGARVILTTDRLARRLASLKEGPEIDCYVLEDSESDARDAASWKELFADEPGEPASPKKEDTAVLFYTSGTTGQPKGVPLSHENILFQLKAARETRLLRDDDRVLLPLPLHHVYPFVIGMLTPLALQLPVILPSGLTGKALVTAMREGDVTVTVGVPRLYKAFFGGLTDKLREIPGGGAYLGAGLALGRLGNRVGVPVGRFLFGFLRKKAAPRLRLLASGGSQLDPKLAQNLEVLGWRVAIGYGLTETAPLLTMKMPGEGPFTSIGRAVEGVELRIDPDALDAENESDPSETETDRERGELLAKGPNVFNGYLNMEEETRESFTEDGWFRTGDVAWIDEKNFVHLSGRISTRIALQGGENVDPEKLEEHYESAGGVEEIGILEYEGQLAALVVADKKLLHEQGAEKAEDMLRDQLKARGKELPSYQQLAHVKMTSQPLDRTRLGKLRRHALAEAFATAGTEGEDADQQRKQGPLPVEDFSSGDRALLEDPRAEKLWDLLCERYPKRPVGPNAHLDMDLGIDSLEWVQLTLAIENKTGVSLSEEELSTAERVRDLMEIVIDASEATDEDRQRNLEHPESMLNEKELRWASPRGPVRLTLAGVLYGAVWICLRPILKIKVSGRANLPQGPCILAPNHASYLDAPCLALALGFQQVRACFWAAYTGIMFKNVMRRQISRLAQVVPIDAKRGPMSSLAVAAQVLDNGHPLVWFPEGHISGDGTLQEFQAGIGLLLQHRDVPVIPVYIHGTYASMPRGRRLPRSGKVRVRFGEAIPAKTLLGENGGREPDEIAAALREEVEALGNPSD